MNSVRYISLLMMSVIIAALFFGCGDGTLSTFPQNVSAKGASNQIVLTWDDVFGASSYNLYWSETSGVTVENGNKIEGVMSPYSHTGLTDGDTYFYVVTATTPLGESQASSEVPGRAALIIVYGDTRSGHDTHREIVNAILDQKPGIAFHVGDLVADGNSAGEWDIFNEISAMLLQTSEFYPAAGNHEVESQLYYDNFELPNNEKWYAVEAAGIHFIVLNTNLDIDEGSEQYLWLLDDLAAIGTGIDFIVVIFHHPPFTTGRHDEDEMGLMDSIVPLFDFYNVDIVFNGHSHTYERLRYNDTYYIVTGGGGAPLEDQGTTNTNSMQYSQLYIKDYHFCELYFVGTSLVMEVLDENLERLDMIEIAP